jgi:hypothetical protein
MGLDLLHYLLLPPDSEHVCVYYLFWLALFLVINVFWDAKTDKTPPFHLDLLKTKVNILYDAATFCSSLLIVTGLISNSVKALSHDTMLPLLIAGISGVLRSLPAVCPYKPAV